MSGFHIRRMTSEDVGLVMKIEEVSFGEYHWSEDSFRSEINNKLGNYFVIIEQDTNKLAGYCGYWNVLDEGHITTLAVHPGFRGKKIGCLLVSHIISTGYDLELKWFTLEVRASNIPALNLYKKFGFENIGVREKYYQDNNEDAIIMWTENIWSEKFKNNLSVIKSEVKDLIS